MAKKRELGQENFEKLLGWLNPDRELAGDKYESIRLRLTTFFTLRRYPMPDEMTDATMDIVFQKIDSIINDYKGEPEPYFYAVAKKVLLKYKTTSQVEVPRHSAQQDSGEDDHTLQKHRCLEKCLKRLKEADRELIKDYYRESKGEKIKLRKDLADQKGVSPKILRVHIHRLKAILEKCIRQCMEK